MNAIINNIVVRYIKTYIKTHEHIDVNVFIGEVSLKNAFFDANQITSLLRQHNPHFSCNLGKLGSLKVEIPWTTISKESVYVTLEDCYCKFTVLYDEHESQTPVEKIANLVLGDEISEKEHSSKLVTNIVQNLKVEVKNLEIEIDIGPELTLSITADRIFYGPIHNNNDPNSTSKIVDISGLKTSLYINKIRNKTLCLSSKAEKISLVTRLHPEIYEYVITAKEQCEVHVSIESLERILKLQGYFQRIFFKAYEINMLTFINILKQKNFVNKVQILCENLLIHLSSNSDLSLPSSNHQDLQLSLTNIDFKLEYYQHTSQLLFFLQLSNLSLLTNHQILLSISPLDQEDRPLLQPFRALETPLQLSEEYSIKALMSYEEKQHNRTTKLELLQYGWQISIFIDNILKQALQISHLIASLQHSLSPQPDPQPIEPREEPASGPKNLKLTYVFSVTIAQNIIKFDTHKPLPLLSTFEFILKNLTFSSLDGLFPTSLYLSLSLNGRVKLRPTLKFLNSELKILQLSAQDPISTPLFDLRETAVDFRFDKVKNSMLLLINSEGMTFKITSDFFHSLLQALQILPKYLKSSPRPPQELSAPVEPDPQTLPLTIAFKLYLKHIDINLGETSHIGPTLQAQRALFREYLQLKILRISLESSHNLQEFHLNQELTCKFFSADNEKTFTLFKKIPFSISLHIPTQNISIKTIDRIEITLVPDTIKYLQAFLSNQALYGHYIVNYLSIPLTLKSDKINSKERLITLLPKNRYSIPIFQEKDQQPLNFYRFQLESSSQGTLVSEPQRIHDIIQSPYSLQIDLRTDHILTKGAINCGLGMLKYRNKEINSVFITGMGYFVNLLGIQCKISYPTLSGENKELVLSPINTHLGEVQEKIKEENFMELFDICECIMEQIAPIEEKRMVLTNLKTNNYFTSSRNIIGGTTIQFFDVNSEECPVFQIIRKPIINTHLYILKTLLICINTLDIPLSVAFETPKNSNFKVELSPNTREFIIPAEDFTVFSHKIPFVIHVNYLNIPFESSPEDIAGYSYTEAFMLEKPRKSFPIKLHPLSTENNPTHMILQVMFSRYYDEETLVCEVKHPMKIENKTEWHFELIYQETFYKDSLLPFKPHDSFHYFAQEKKFQIKLGLPPESSSDDKRPMINIDLNKLQETGSCVLSFNFVAHSDQYYQVPLIMKYSRSEQDLLTISPLVVVNSELPRKITVGGFPIDQETTSHALYFPVSIDTALNNQAFFFASVDSSLNIISPGLSIFDKVITNDKPIVKIFGKSASEILLEKSLKNFLKDYFSQNDYNPSHPASEFIGIIAQKKEIEGQILITFQEGYSEVLPNYFFYKNYCNQTLALSLKSKTIGTKNHFIQALSQDLLQVPYKLDKYTTIEIVFPGDNPLKISPDKKHRTQQFKNNSMDYIIIYYLENNIINLEIHFHQEFASKKLALLAQTNLGWLQINDFALNVSLYLENNVQDHVEFYLDFKDIAFSRDHFQLQLKKFMVNSCLSQNWSVAESYDKNVSLSTSISLDYKILNNLLIISNLKLELYNLRIAISDPLLAFLANFLSKTQKESLVPEKETPPQSPTNHKQEEDPHFKNTEPAPVQIPHKKSIIFTEELLIPKLDISMDLDLKGIIKLSHTISLETFKLRNRVISTSALIQDISSSYVAQLISGFPSLLLRFKRIPNPFTLLKNIKNLSVPTIHGATRKTSLNLPIWDLSCQYHLQTKVLESVEEEIVFMGKCKLLIQKAQFPEKKCYVVVTSRNLYILQYGEILDCYAIKRIENLVFSKKKEQLSICIFQEEPVIMRVNQKQYEKILGGLKEVLI